MSVKDYIEKDYYAALGVTSSASNDEIKKAYRKLARKFHPDVNKGDTEAENRFKEISEAYDVLADDKRRKEYDEVRSASANGGYRYPGGSPGGGSSSFDFNDAFSNGGGGADGLGDLFGGLFGGTGRRRGPRRGGDLETQTSMSFRDAVEGSTVSLNLPVEGACPTCAGSGAKPGTKVNVCATCGGQGQVSRNAGGFAIPEACPNCHGSGRSIEHPCTTCRGRGRTQQSRIINARIPSGVKDGQRIRLKGKGSPGEKGAPAGDLFVTVHVGKHPVFGRKGRHLTITVPVTFDEAALGADVRVPTLQGDAVTLRIPAGTSSGRTFRVRGRGIAGSGKDAQGDLLVSVDVAVPQRLDGPAREAVEAYRAAMAGHDPRAELTQLADQP